MNDESVVFGLSRKNTRNNVKPLYWLCGLGVALFWLIGIELIGAGVGETASNGPQKLSVWMPYSRQSYWRGGSRYA